MDFKLVCLCKPKLQSVGKSVRVYLQSGEQEMQGGNTVEDLLLGKFRVSEHRGGILVVSIKLLKCLKVYCCVKKITILSVFLHLNTDEERRQC